MSEDGEAWHLHSWERLRFGSHHPEMWTASGESRKKGCREEHVTKGEKSTKARTLEDRGEHVTAQTTNVE